MFVSPFQPTSRVAQKSMFFGGRAPRHYQQTEESGTWDSIVVNNCVTCSLKNLLSLYGYGAKDMDVQAGLRDLLGRLWQDGTGDISLYVRQRDEEYNLTSNIIPKYLDDIGFEFRLLYPADVQTDASVIENKPLLIADQPLSGDELATTLLEGPTYGHAYLVYPGRRKGLWYVSDSMHCQRRQTSLDAIVSHIVHPPDNTYSFVYRIDTPLP